MGCSVGGLRRRGGANHEAGALQLPVRYLLAASRLPRERDKRRFPRRVVSEAVLESSQAILATSASARKQKSIRLQLIVIGSY